MSAYRFWIRVARPIVQILWPVRIINRNKFVEGKGVYVCNHYSYFDPVHIVTDLFQGRTNLLAKEESMQSWIGGKFLGYIGAIPVKRGEADMRAIKQCITVLREDKSLVIFPEGTRNKAGTPEMLSLKDGPVVFALKTGAEVYPMMYHHPIRLFRKTYLIIGNKLDLDEYRGRPINEVRESATIRLQNEMARLWNELDDIVSDPQKLRAAKRQDRADRKQVREANRRAKKLSRQAKKGAKTARIDKEN